MSLLIELGLSDLSPRRSCAQEPLTKAGLDIHPWRTRLQSSSE
jgi:hypothetical protein